MTDYIKKISKFDIISKEGTSVPFIPNKPQRELLKDMENKNIVLKARQIGFSSLILAMFTIDFLTLENSRSIVISHDGDSALKLLDRVKFYITSAEEKGLQVNMKYNSRQEMMNADKNSSFYIGKAGSKSFGRGDTINNLHLSEFAFYPDPELLLSSVLQAVVPTGKVFIESTANGMNFYKTLWDESVSGARPFRTHFYGNKFYDEEFLKEKKRELGEELFKQEYPETALEAFISSGNPFFDRKALELYARQVKEPERTFETYYDLSI